jgi:hypothetical protein
MFGLRHYLMCPEKLIYDMFQLVQLAVPGDLAFPLPAPGLPGLLFVLTAKKDAMLFCVAPPFFMALLGAVEMEVNMVQPVEIYFSGGVKQAYMRAQQNDTALDIAIQY